MAVRKEKLDFLTRVRIRELILMGLIAVTALLANLPQDYVEQTLGVNPATLVAVLAIAVIIGLFLYLKFFFFVAVVLLIAGANMPEQIADGLNVSKVPIMLALMALVGVGLVNYLVRLMPTGLEPRSRDRSPEGIRALFYAIEKDNLVYAQKVLSMNFDPDLHHDNGYTPLTYAAMKGSVAMVGLLLRNGASAALTTREGDSAIELALRYGHAEAANLLKRARQGGEDAGEETTPAPQV
jgi:uncharacterized protein